MPDFATFDRRNYNTVPAHEGYSAWAASYEETIKPDMDGRLLDQIETVSWRWVERAADLGCGTGRTGAWLRERGVKHIDGVDLTEAMLERARERGVFSSLRVADARSSGLPASSYDVVTTCLVDEHLPELGALYREAARLLVPGGAYVLIGFHPFFIMRSGMPTHFPGPGGEPIAIETHVHLPSAHVRAAIAAGLSLAEMREQVIDDHWIATKPSWEKHRDVPISFAFVWRR